MANWPNDFPAVRLPVQHTQEDNRLRTKMDAGPKKMRRRYTAIEEPFQTHMVFAGDKYKELWDFYNNTLGGGSLRFTWEHPVDDSEVEMRFVEPPKGELMVGGSPIERQWMVRFKFEIMP